MKDKKDFLIVSESFYSLQGEGQTMGVPAVFLRLAGCNILCKSDSWICDTIEVWQKGRRRFFQDVLKPEEIAGLGLGAHLVITGGEPLLHQKKIVKYLTWLEENYDMIVTVEIETNGTIMPSLELQQFVKYWNCSPKLSNSGVLQSDRLKLDVIDKINSFPHSIFKFVIETREDAVKMLDDYGSNVSRDKIFLMPAGESQEKLEKTRKVVASICIEWGFRYTERLHIVIWNQKTGV